MYYWEDEEDDDPVEGYQKEVREMANSSLADLRIYLQGKPKSVSPKAKADLSKIVKPRTLAYTQSREEKYQNASETLKEMLHSQPAKNVSSLQKSLPRNSAQDVSTLTTMPTAQEASQILQSQATYMQQLETENTYIREELAAIKQKMSDLIEENRRLHEELRTSVLHEIVHESGAVLTKPASAAALGPDVFEAAAGVHKSKRWQADLEKLSSLHEAKAKHLESQLASAKSEIEQYERQIEEFKICVRMCDSQAHDVATREDGTPASFLNDTERSVQIRPVERITKERDELMQHVNTLKHKLHEMTAREDAAYQQIKKGIQLVEQAQLEQTEALIEKEQMSEKLSKLRERFEQQIHENQFKLNQERDVVRKENKVLIEELQAKMRELSEAYITCQSKLEKITRENQMIQNELEEARNQLKHCDTEITHVRESYHAENTSATLQRQQAYQQVFHLRAELEHTLKDTEQEKSRIRAEMEEIRRRLHHAERELINAKEECIHITSTNQELEREVHLSKMARDVVERSRSDDLHLVKKKAEQREQHLNDIIDEIENKHGLTEQEMDEILHKQNDLIGRLREECRRQTGQIDMFNKKYRVEVGTVQKENTQLKMRLERAVLRLNELEQHGDQHGRVQEKMRDRLKQLDDHGQTQAQQILDLLSQHSSMARDRQLITKEVEFLRTKLLTGSKCDVNKVNSAQSDSISQCLN